MTTLDPAPSSHGQPVPAGTHVGRGAVGEHGLALVVWAAFLIAGFAVVLTLGAPLQSSRDARNEAYQLTAPVTQHAALAAARTIVETSYAQYASAAPTIDRVPSHGDELFVITYSQRGQLSGVRILISIGTGKVTASVFP
jgi:hypothetical protein